MDKPVVLQLHLYSYQILLKIDYPEGTPERPVVYNKSQLVNMNWYSGWIINRDPCG